MSAYHVTEPVGFATPEQILWKAILLRVIRDAEGNYCTIAECAEARMWLLHPENRDRTMICDYINLDETALVDWARRSLKPLANLYPNEAEKYNG